MSNWVNGNKPEKQGWYWLTVRNNDGCTKTAPDPVKYDGAWIGIDAEEEKIIAYSLIAQPKNYNTIGTGIGYYIRVERKEGISYYGKGYMPAERLYSGYSDVDKAKKAMRRMKKMDLEEYKDLKAEYSIVDGKGEKVD